MTWLVISRFDDNIPCGVDGPSPPQPLTTMTMKTATTITITMLLKI
jgi:hypothetical protein